MNIINTLAPIFIVIGLGAVLSRTRFLSSECVEGLTKLAYWVGLPCVLFYKVALADYDFDVAAKAYAVFLFGFVCSAAVAYIIAYIMRIPSSIIGTFVHGSFHANLSFVGFAVIVLHLANSGLDAAIVKSVESLAAIMMILGVITNNVSAVTVLLVSKHQFGYKSLVTILKGLVQNPLIISSVAGIIYSVYFEGIPKVLSNSFEAVGQLTFPAALLAIGATLAKSKITANISRAVAASIIKVALAPLFGALAVMVIGLEKEQALVPIVMLACPTAIAAFIASSKLGPKPELTTAIIVFSTIFSIASLSIVLAIY